LPPYFITKFSTFEDKIFLMKRILFIIAILAGIYAFYEQSKSTPNVWISAICIVVFMVGLLFLNKKTTSNSFSDSDKENKQDDK